MRTFVFLLLLLPTTLFAQLNYGWTHTTSGTSGEYTHFTVPMNDGSIIVIGSFNGDIILGIGANADTLENLDATFNTVDTYIQKLDAEGNHLWARSIGAVDFLKVEDVQYDAQLDRLYLAGMFQDSVDFDPGSGKHMLTAPNNFADGFLCVLSSSGSFIDAFSFSGPMSDAVRSIAVLPNSHLMLTGSFGDSVDLDPSATTRMHYATPGSTFLLELDDQLHYNWSADYGDFGFISSEVRTNPTTGGFYLIGGCSDSTNFNLSGGSNTHGPLPGAQSLILSSYSSDHNLNWVRTFLLDSASSQANVISPFLALEIDSSGNAYIGGSYGGSFLIDSATTFFSFQAYKAFVLKVLANSTLAFAHDFGGTSGPNGYAQDCVRDFAIRNDSTLFLIGTFTGTEDMNPGPGYDTLHGTNAINLYAAQWTTSGTFIDAKAVLASSLSYATHGALTQRGDLLISGHFYGTADFDFGPGTDQRTSYSLDGLVLQFTCNQFHTDTLYGTDSLQYAGQWYFQSGTTITDTLNASNGCDSILTLITSIDTSSNIGAQEGVIQEIIVYPNPVSESTLFIDGLLTNHHFTVYNSTGEVVLTGHTRDKINLNPLPAGAYVLRLEGLRPMRVLKLP